MADFTDQDLSGSRFHHVDLRGSELDHVDLSGSRLRMVDLADVELRAVALSKVRMRGVELHDVDISGELLDVRVNGVDIGPLVEAELDRRHPQRAAMRPDDPAGFREAWDVVEQLWAGTVARARRLDPDQLHESVDGEWSFIETLRHLAFATESWVGRGVLGDPSPWHPLSLPWDEMPDTDGVPRDRDVRPSLAEALELRHDRMAMVRRVVDGLTDAQLAAHTAPLRGVGWPPAGETFPVQECLLVVLNEEWHHRLFAERDLDALEARQG